MTKVYVLQEIGFEYNDEIYRREETGFPRKVFKNKQEAEKALIEANKTFYKGHDGYGNCYYGFCPAEYTYGQLEDISSLDEDRILEKLKNAFPDNYPITIDDILNCSWRVKTKPTEKQIKILSKVFNLIQPYEIIEVDYE